MKGGWAVPVIFSILVLGSLSSSQQSFAQISPGFFDFGGHCYGLTAEDVWAATEDEAVSFGGHLATINDVAENSFVQGLIPVASFSFIGYNDIAVEDTFEWVSGEVVIPLYENWSLSNPSDSGALGEDTVDMSQASGTWNDGPPGTIHTGIIELDDTCEFAFAVIGGTILPIDTTALLVAGAQTTTPWLILGVLSAVGIGIAVFTLKRSR